MFGKGFKKPGDEGAPVVETQKVDQVNNQKPDDNTQQASTGDQTQATSTQPLNFDEEIKKRSEGRYNSFDDVINLGKNYKKTKSDLESIESNRYPNEQIKALADYYNKTGKGIEDYASIQMKNWSDARDEELLEIETRNKYNDLPDEEVRFMMDEDFGLSLVEPEAPNREDFDGDDLAFGKADEAYKKALRNYKVKKALRTSTVNKVRKEMITAQEEDKMPSIKDNSQEQLELQRQQIESFSKLNSESINDIKPIEFKFGEGETFTFSIDEDSRKQLVKETEDTIINGSWMNKFTNDKGEIVNMNGLQQEVFMLNNFEKIIEMAIKFGEDRGVEYQVSKTSQNGFTSKKHHQKAPKSQKGTFSQQFFKQMRGGK